MTAAPTYDIPAAAHGLGAVLAMMLVLWGLSVRRRHVSIVDSFWAPGFVLLGATITLLLGQLSPRAALVLALSALWALRLSTHLHRRNRGQPEDRRYAEVRARRGPAFVWQSLYVVFGLQALLLFVIAAPIQLAVMAPPSPLGSLDAAGGALALGGIALEGLADRQLRGLKPLADRCRRAYVGAVMRILLLLLGATAWVACSPSSEPEPSPPTAVEAKPPAPQPAAPEPAPAPAPTAAIAGKPGEISEHMWAHYVAALKARDAIIGGHRARAKEPLTWLAAHAYPTSLPEAWRSHAAAVQAAAQRALDAVDDDDAARAIGELGAACGACHAAMQNGPAREPTGFSELGAEDLRARMHRHGWAMERMWEGLIVPWDASYMVGAQVLAEGQLELEKRDAKALAEGLSAVRALGRQAATLEHGNERALAYGDLIATCADCHRAHGVELGDDAQADAAEAAEATEAPTK